MTNRDLALSYLSKAQGRLVALAFLRDEGAHSDVMVEAGELVELLIKAILWEIGVAAAKEPDPAPFLLEYADKLPVDVRADCSRAAAISDRLLAHRELAFYGNENWIPTERYTAQDSRSAYEDAAWVLSLARRAIGPEVS